VGEVSVKNIVHYTWCLSRYFVQETVSFSSQAATCCFQSNHLKVEAILLSILPKEKTSELASLSSHYSFNAERQIGKLWIPSYEYIIAYQQIQCNWSSIYVDFRIKFVNIKIS